MSRRVLITADTVHRAASAGFVEVPEGALITPLARDVARERGVRLGVPAAAPSPSGATPRTDAQGADLQERVHAIVAALLAGGGAGTTGSTPHGSARHPVKLCSGASARTEPFAHAGPPPGMDVRTGDVVTAQDGSPMAAGYMSLTTGEFRWTFDYDEIQVVLEGELHIGTPQGVRIARPGDVMYIPKGSEITFGTPTWTRFVYVTFPADWEAGL